MIQTIVALATGLAILSSAHQVTEQQAGKIHRVGIALHSRNSTADIHGFSVGYANSACIVCDFREGPMLRRVNYRTLDSDANTLGTRNFFVALRLYGKAHACAEALGVYGPQGVIHSGLVEK